MKISYDSTLLLVSIFSISYVHGLPFQVIYILAGLCLLILSENIVSHPIDSKCLYLFFFLLIYVLLNLLLQICVGAQLGSIVNFTICWLMIIVGFYLGLGRDYLNTRTTVIKLAWFAVGYSFVDAAWRFFHPRVDQVFGENPFFYQYKFNSLMYEDSNYVGIMLVCINGILISYMAYRKLSDKILLLLIFVATLLTFSRGSIIAVIFTYFLCLFLNSRMIFKIISIVSISAFCTATISVLYEDGSFRSKFLIIELFGNVFKTLDLTSKLIGVGLGNSVNYLGIGAHNIFVVGGMELGVIGSALYITFILLICIFVGRASLYLILPYFLNGFSLLSTSVPVLFLYLGVALASRISNDRISGGYIHH